MAGDQSGHGGGGVMKPIGECKEQGDDDDQQGNDEYVQRTTWEAIVITDIIYLTL
jgi:hypothetical protein